MKIAFISTMNLKLYNFYGKRFLKEFAEFSSPEIILYIVFEGEYPEEILHISKNIIILPLLSQNHKNFMKKFGHLEEAKGLRVKVIEENGNKHLKAKFDYRWHAVRFSFKPFSIHQCLEYIPPDLNFLIWTDADLRCKKNFTPDDLLQFMPNDKQIMSYLGRKNAYSECGFLGFNLKEQKTFEYINRMIEMYETGEFFTLEQWHDSFIWDHVRLDFERNMNCQFKDISGEGHDKAHVYVNTKLDEFFDHLKGPDRKELGKSKEEDYSRGINDKIKKRDW